MGEKKSMKTFFMILIVLGLSSLCLAPLSADEENPTAKTVLTFHELRANPESFGTSELTFRGQFHKLSDVFSPFFTYFSPEAYINFSAWDYDAPIWIKEVYKEDFPFLYVAKSDRRICAIIAKLPPYTRFEATGKIQSTFDKIPWIQVTDFKVLPDRLSNDTIRYMAKGYALQRRNKFLDAAVAFHRAWAKGIPGEVQALIRKEEGKCLYAGGSYEEAVDVLDEALDLCVTSEDKKDVAFVLKEAEAMIEYLEDMEDREEEAPPPPAVEKQKDDPQVTPPEGQNGEEEVVPPEKEGQQEEATGKKKEKREGTEGMDPGMNRLPPPIPPEEVGPKAPGSTGPGMEKRAG